MAGERPDIRIRMCRKPWKCGFKAPVHAFLAVFFKKKIKIFVRANDFPYICQEFGHYPFTLTPFGRFPDRRTGAEDGPHNEQQYTHLISNTMNKTDLVNALAAKGLSKADSKTAVDTVLESIADALKEGDKVALLGFGTFSLNERPAREGINPATKEKIQIAAKKVIKFKAGAELADAVNK